MQTTLTVGFISIATDLLFLLRCLTTTATLPDARTMGTNIPLVESPEPGLQPLHSGELQPRTVLQDAISERAKERKGYRDINGLLQLFYFVPMILGTVVSVLYIKTENDESKVKLVRQLRFVNTICTKAVDSVAYCDCMPDTLQELLRASSSAACRYSLSTPRSPSEESRRDQRG